MKKIAMLCLLMVSTMAFASHSESLFYTLPEQGEIFSQEQLQQIKQNARRINVIAPQIYSLDEQGEISGSIDPALLLLAKEKNIKIMPLVVNQHFNQEKFHAFLNNPAAQEKAISEMRALCQKNLFWGLQFDFENIHVSDKPLLSQFFQSAAQVLHQNGFILSIATIPPTSEPFYTDYDRWFFENWSGAYDYEVLGQAGDFVSLMTYDRHTGMTTPGPIAPIDWMEATVRNVLKTVPAKKISLGIPLYSGYWSTGKSSSGSIPEKYIPRVREAQIDYSQVLSLLKKYREVLIWHPRWKSSYVMYTERHRNEYLFVENVKSFWARQALAKRYHLRGISAWKLGQEDPKIWSVSVHAEK